MGKQNLTEIVGFSPKNPFPFYPGGSQLYVSSSFPRGRGRVNECK